MARFNNRKKITKEKIEGYSFKEISLTKMAKRQLFVTLFSILGVTIISLGSAYAVFTSVSRSSDYNVVKVGTLDIDFGADSDNTINLNGQYPMSDTDGLKLTPYTFTITNTGSLEASYEVLIQDDTDMITQDNCTNNQLSKDYIKYSLDGSTTAVLSSLASNDYRIDTGTLASGASKTFTLYVWIKEGVGNDVLNKHYHGKIVVNGESGDESLFEQLAAGAYYTDGTYKDWETLKAEGLVTDTEVLSDAFNYNTSLSVFVVANGVETIRPDAFSWCENLNRVVIPNTVTKIYDYAFNDCYNLSSIAIPNSVTYLAGDEELFRNMDIVLYYSGTLTNSKNWGANSLTIKPYCEAPVELLPNNISECETVTLAPGLYAEDGTMTYSWQELLDNGNLFNLSGSLYTGGTSSLSGKLVIDDSIISIGDCYEHNNLTSIVIPTSVTTIATNAFRGVTSLQSIEYMGTKEQWNSITFGSNWNMSCSEITVHCTDGDIVLAAS